LEQAVLYPVPFYLSLLNSSYIRKPSSVACTLYSFSHRRRLLPTAQYVEVIHSF